MGRPGKGHNQMTTEKTPAVKATDWTEDEIKVIAMYQEKLGMTRSNAVRKLRTDKRTPAQQLADGPVAKAKPEPTTAPKAKPAKGEHKATRQGKYNKEMVIKLYMEEGLNPTEIA